MSNKEHKWYYIPDFKNMKENPAALEVVNRENLAKYSVLELGAFEGWDTITISKAAKKVTSLEGSKENFEKCEIVKKHFNLKNVTFLHKDIEAGITDIGNFDFVLARGIIHHLSNPVKALREIASISNRVWLGIRVASETFPNDGEIEIEGYKGRKLNFTKSAYHLGIHNYGVWLYRRELLRLLRSLGYANIIMIHDIEYPNKDDNYHVIFAYKESYKRVPIEEFYDHSRTLPFISHLSKRQMEMLDERIEAEQDTNPLDVVYLEDKKKYLVVDGRHRFHEGKRLGIKSFNIHEAKSYQLERVIGNLINRVEDLL